MMEVIYFIWCADGGDGQDVEIIEPVSNEYYEEFDLWFSLN